MQIGRSLLVVIEIAILSVLILAARCTNYPDVFVGGNIYFTDADCYARMTRVRLCAEHPALILRHHQFENFPQGTTPHTTAPLDYLILFLSILLRPLTTQAIDLAGALISPLLALAGGWFLWWWSRRMQFRFRWALLVLYAISPILVHGGELGRPDHQSLVMLLVTVALCAEWSAWNTISKIAWAFAIWVSAYEPLLLLLFLIVLTLLQDRHLLFASDRRAGWIWFGAILVLALLVERRLPSIQSSAILQHWSRTIGELSPVSPLDSIWFRWAGYLILIAPVLVWMNRSGKTKPPVFIPALLIATFGLTIWQARWGYLFLSIFVLALPALLETIKSRAAVWVAFTLSIFPILKEWDGKLWPNEVEAARRAQDRHEQIELRALAHEMMSAQIHPFVAPWWLSPALAYWSGQPAVAGSSHESIDGIADSARFFLAENPEAARKILVERKVEWIVAYDSERVAANSAAILRSVIPANPLCRSIDRTPGQVPHFLTLVSQNGTAKLFAVANNR